MTSLLARLPRPGRRTSASREPAAAGWLSAGAALAVTVTGLLGLWLALLVIATLDPDGGLSAPASARLAGQLWLLAQGAELTLGSGPLVLAPLLLTLGAAWGLAQAGRWVVRRHALREPGRVAVVLAVLGGVHVGLTLLLAWSVDGPGAHVGLPRVAVGAVVLVLVAGGAGVARESGLAAAVLAGLPGPAPAVVRGVLAGLLTLLGLCAVVVAVALAFDTAGFAALVSGLGGAGAGALGLLGLSALLLPNAALAVAGLAAGPGFVVGAGTAVSVGGVTLGSVPALPLLAALPDTQAVPLLAFVAQAVPVLAGLAAGVALGRTMTADDGGSVVAGLWGVVTGVLLGVVVAVSVWAGGGRLGDGALAEVGAPALATGLAIGAQAGIAAALAALVARWRSRD